MRIILIGNYSLDKQESMQRFAEVLYSGFLNSGYHCEIWRPKIFAGSFSTSTESGLAKWFGYIDKWILFPMILFWRLRKKNLQRENVRFHVCDHSNSPYLRHLPKDRTGITCHDVLAIRGALGYEDAYCPATSAGKLLQKWILNNLRGARLLAAASKLTLSQLEDLSTGKVNDKRDWRVIHMGFNAEFKPIDAKQRIALLLEANVDTKIPYILHVGSNQPRKNRIMLVDMVAELGGNWNGNIYYAGHAADESILSHAESLGLRNRVFSVVGPSHLTLLALYGGCEAFVFPSFSEGFGWPLIEAQACEAPVIASKIQPMPEVSNGAAIHVDPTNPKEFAEALLKLKDDAFRSDLIRRGIENCLASTPLT